MVGVIKNLNERGFGFIDGQDGLSYFFHRSALSDAQLFSELREGDEVELLEVENAPKGWRATKLAPLAAA